MTWAKPNFESDRALGVSRPARKICLEFVLVMLLLISTAIYAETNSPLRVQLHWSHQAQFAGYYEAEAHIAHERGAKKILLLEGGVGIDPLDKLAKSEADVAVGWMPQALEARRKGADIVNVAQVFRRPGMALAFNKPKDGRSATDLAGHSVGVWNVGDEISVRLWLQRAGIPESSLHIVQQAGSAKDLISGKVQCATVMIYNEYWNLVEAGFNPNDLLVIRFADEGLGMLEDGLYVSRTRLDDPAFRRQVAEFLKAAAAGWQQAREHPDEAVSLTMAKSPGLNVTHQHRMLESILNLIPPDKPFGLLEPEEFERTVTIFADHTPDPIGIRRAAKMAWTHRIWYEAGIGGNKAFTMATRYYFVAALKSKWFYALDLAGTVAFGLAGFMRARQRRYNLWGAFILTMLPAVGGGTLRDLLIGGDRHPPFIFQDTAYMSIVFSIVILGTVLSRLIPSRIIDSRSFDRWLAVFDTVGLAAFTVVGAKVALIADLAWYWVPICAALTCAGGGMLLDVITGREPRTFLGEPYEEIAVLGGLLLYGFLHIANKYEHSPWVVTVSILLTLIVVYTIRRGVILSGVKSYRLGAAQAPERSSSIERSETESVDQR